MTVLVGVKCTDGIVIGTDGAATSADGNAQPVMRIPTDKIKIIAGKIILAGTGSVGLGQRFAEITKRLAQRPQSLPVTCMECNEEIAKEVFQNFTSTGAHIRGNKYQFGALAALPYGENGELVEFEFGTLQPEIKAGKLFFVSMGSGQNLADPFIAFVNNVLWKNEPPDMKWGIFGVFWALMHTIEFAHGLVGKPISIATLTKSNTEWKARMLEQDELQEHEQNLDGILRKIGEYPTSLIDDAEAIEPPPKPDGKD